MQEKILHTIWQHSLFRLQNLHTTLGEPLTIVEVGTPNVNQGPDFLSAKIKIGQILWAGHIEIDLLTSLWHTHKHDSSPHFKNVVLHVVWENDKAVPPHSIPILELKHIVSPFFVQSFLAYMEQNKITLPCQPLLNKVPASIWDEWKNELIDKRWQTKAYRLQQILNARQSDWEQSCWIWLAQYMGGKQNATAFEAMARHIPISIIYKEKQSIEQIEALLFGVAGILRHQHQEQDERVQKLQHIYQHLAIKYGLTTIEIPLSYLRMRPYQFPDLRLAQLATLLFHISRIIDIITDISTWKKILAEANQTMPIYWRSHFRLGKPSASEHSCTMGEDFQHTLMINVWSVCLFSYAQANGKNEIDAIKSFLQSIPPENNTVSRFWNEVNNYTMKNAYDTQAHLELFEQYCQKKHCLSCRVGQFLLDPSNKDLS